MKSILSNKRTVAIGLAMAAAMAAPAHAHHAYNNTGPNWAADTPAQGYTASTNGSDGLTRGSVSTAAPATPTNSSSYYQGTAPVTWLAAFHASDIGLELTTANPTGAPNTTCATCMTHELGTQDALSNKGAGAGFQLAASGSSASGVDWGYLRADYAASGLQVTVTRDTSAAADNNGGQDAIQPWLALYAGWDNTYNGITGNATSADTSLSGSLPAQSRSGTFTDGANNPFGTTGLLYLGSVMNSGGLSTITYIFNGPILANEHLTLLVGGANGTSGNYIADVTMLAPVPIPAAVWLFGSALAGMGVFGRRKPSAQA